MIQTQPPFTQRIELGLFYGYRCLMIRPTGFVSNGRRVTVEVDEAGKPRTFSLPCKSFVREAVPAPEYKPDYLEPWT